MPPIVGVILMLASMALVVFTSDGGIYAFGHYQEYIIIFGMAVSFFAVSNSGSVQIRVISRLLSLGKSKKYDKTYYVNLLLCILNFLKYNQKNSRQDVEKHIENPKDSPLFKKHNILLDQDISLTFFCDFFRLIALGFDDSAEAENMMNDRIDEIRQYNDNVSGAMQKLADAMPGLGLVAAIIGMIMALVSAGDDPAILAAKIAGAMVGTFLGIFLSYAVLFPLANRLDMQAEMDMKTIECIKLAILANMRGHTPSICIGFSRQIIPSDVKPSFYEIELAIEGKNRE